MDSAGTKTIKFWGQSNPVAWDGEQVTTDLPLVPTFGTFESKLVITDVNMRRLIHDVNIYNIQYNIPISDNIQYKIYNIQYIQYTIYTIYKI